MKAFDEYPDILDVRNLADMLNIGIVLAYRLAKEGKFNAKKIGREYKIAKSVVIKYLTEEGEQ